MMVERKLSEFELMKLEELRAHLVQIEAGVRGADGILGELDLGDYMELRTLVGVYGTLLRPHVVTELRVELDRVIGLSRVLGE